MFMDLTIVNKNAEPVSDFAIQFNKNSFALSPAGPLSISSVAGNTSQNASVPLGNQGGVQKMEPLEKLQVAVKTSIEVLYFSCNIPYHVLFAEDGKIERADYLSTWKSIEESTEAVSTVVGVNADTEGLIKLLERNNIFVVHKRSANSQDFIYVSTKFINNIVVLGEISLRPGIPTVQLALRTTTLDIIPGAQASFEAILQSAQGGDPYSTA